MKPIQIFMGFILLSTFGLNAQKIMYGISTGFNVVNRNYSDYDVSSPIISCNANAYIGYKSQGYWGLSIEPGFIRKGCNFHYAPYRFKIRDSYLQMPILVNIYFTDKLFLSAGTEIAYYTQFLGTYDDLLSYRKKLELSGLIGINYNISKKIDIGLRYNHGITSISSFSKRYYQYFQILLRIKFKV